MNKPVVWQLFFEDDFLKGLNAMCDHCLSMNNLPRR